jgi:hypothetical protein
MGVIQKDTKETNRHISYEDISSEIENNYELSYTIDEYQIDYRDVISKLITKLEIFIEEENLNENEEKLGYALLDIFVSFDTLFQIGDGNKFNKNLILLSIREMTSLSTKEIRVAIRKFKKLYSGILGNFLE